MVFAFKDQELNLATEPAQDGKKLLGLFERAAVILVAVQDQQRCMDMLGISNGRLAPK